MNAPEVVKILKVRNEGYKVKSFVLDKKIKIKAGQFAMVWIPNFGEKPFSFSNTSENVEFIVKEVGEFTRKFCSIKKGELLGIRGPYGNGFKISGKNICIVAGGVGIAPLLPLMQELKRKKKAVFILFGAKSKKDILCVDKIKKYSHLITTEDGSLGREGLCTDCLEEVIESKGIDQIYTCGPEKMMKKVMDIALKKGISCQLSLERYMKCGVGICGSCCIDPIGLRVCKDGPIFTAEQLKNTEFGKYKRNSFGAKENV
ncbi:MAG: dihydroorotate dehydrogenase electron transfer subunit [Candidatus Altiarchaeota archaeon]